MLTVGKLSVQSFRVTHAPHIRKKLYGSLTSVEKRYTPQGMVEESTHHDRRGCGMFHTCKFQQV